MEAVCIARECVERPLAGGCGDADTTADTSDADVDGPPDGDVSEVDVPDTSEVPDYGETSMEVSDASVDAEIIEGDTGSEIVVACVGAGEVCSGLGECGSGMVECDEAGAPRCSTEPLGSKSEASDEVCDDLDNDCDGSTDEDYLPGGTVALERARFFEDEGKAKGAPCGTGECAQGLVVCAADTTSLTCSTDVKAEQLDPCNGRDDNCDGMVDDDFVSPASPTFRPLSDAAYAGDDGKAKGASCGAGECTTDGVNGVVVCSEDGARLVCTTDGRGSFEACDGLDNDCNGIVDDPFLAATGTPLQDAKAPADNGKVKGDSCGAGRCTGGHVVCAANKTSLVCDSESQAALESCDGIDNDCDGAIDAQFEYDAIAVGGACDGIGGCGAGTVVCAVGSTTIATCSTNPNGTASQASTEACDQIDSDCDGTTDEGFTYLGTLIGASCNGVGECGVGQVACGSGGTATCSTNPDGAASQAVAEVCGDGKDNDCDAATDEGCGPVCNPACQNGGLCTGSNTCSCTGTGYGGSVCATPVCTLSCLNGGTCSAPDTCSCVGTGYTGSRCETPICALSCLNGGTCSAPDTCACAGTGYTGTRCETPVCSQPCQHGGGCTGPNTCNCTGTGYTGSVCQSPVCTPTCLNGGSCIAPDTCECSGYTGSRCETPVCAPACENGGNCTGPNACQCVGAYSGSACEILTGYAKVLPGTFTMGSPANGRDPL